MTKRRNREWLRSLTRLTALGTLGVGLAAAGCEDGGDSPFDPPAGDGSVSRAYDAWVPGSMDSCTPADHNRYSAVGPDGKLYPTWHPPVDPVTGCTFGHEHGRDPRGSWLYLEGGPVLFGYANEQLDEFDPGGMRHEDHVGHKIEWENDVPMGFRSEVAGELLEIRCDVLAKLHQGSHSKDAFTNNVHELVYRVRCSEGTRFSITMLTAIGEGGTFVRRCEDVEIDAGAPTPSNSPAGGGHRRIPDRSCVERFMLVPSGERSSYGQALRESWQLSESVRTADGRRLVSFGPYFNIDLPSRFYDASAEGLVGRPIDVCYEVTPAGERTSGGPCEASTEGGAAAGVTFDDPRSLFNGVRRDMDINHVAVSNVDGPEIWYTDPYGKNGRTTPFPGSVAQVVGRVESPTEVQVDGPSIGRDRDYGGPGVHAPN